MIIVTYDNENHKFVAMKQGDIGMCIIGDGATVAEAVGDWCIFSGVVKVKCDPPSLLEKYQTGFKPFPRR